jgi:hypothetical protein
MQGVPLSPWTSLDVCSNVFTILIVME